MSTIYERLADNISYGYYNEILQPAIIKNDRVLLKSVADNYKTTIEVVIELALMTKCYPYSALQKYIDPNGYTLEFRKIDAVPWEPITTMESLAPLLKNKNNLRIKGVVKDYKDLSIPLLLITARYLINRRMIRKCSPLSRKTIKSLHKHTVPMVDEPTTKTFKARKGVDLDAIFK